MIEHWIQGCQQILEPQIYQGYLTVIKNSHKGLPDVVAAHSRPDTILQEHEELIL